MAHDKPLNPLSPLRADPLNPGYSNWDLGAPADPMLVGACSIMISVAPPAAPAASDLGMLALAEA